MTERKKERKKERKVTQISQFVSIFGLTCICVLFCAGGGGW